MTRIETETWTDPIVEEVRAAREAIAARYDYDVEKLAAALAERSKAAGRRIAPPPVDAADGGRRSAARPVTETR